MIFVPDCARNWGCPQHAARKMYKKFSPLYVPESRDKPWYAPTLYVGEVHAPSVRKRMSREAKRVEAMTFTVGFKYNPNIFASTQPLKDYLDQVTTAAWVQDIIRVTATVSPPSRITGMDKWAIEEDESEWVPLVGKTDFDEARRIKARATSRARKERWAPQRTIRYVEGQLEPETEFPRELRADDEP